MYHIVILLFTNMKYLSKYRHKPPKLSPTKPSKNQQLAYTPLRSQFPVILDTKLIP